jgi:chromosome segregation ATPase
MLRKKDLVKQFELVVQQEIIEHNKAISASNLAINKQKEAFEIEVNKLKENHRLLLAEYSCVSSQFNAVSGQSIDLLNKVSKLDTKCYKTHEQNNKQIQNIDKSVEIVQINEKKLEEELKSLASSLTSTKKQITELKKIHENELNRLKASFTKQLKKQKEEILNRPSEAEKVKEEFMEELSKHKIEKEGLLKEIKVLKKTVFINEKKIEHLSTLIERINKI